MPASIRAQAGAALASTSDPVIPVPSGTVAGDLLVAFVDTRNTARYTGDSGGWTWLGSVGRGGNTGTGNLATFARIAGGSEPGTYTLPVSTGTNAGFTATVLALAGANGVDVFATQTDGTSQAAKTAPSVVTTAADALILRATMIAVGNTTPPTVTWPSPATVVDTRGVAISTASIAHSVAQEPGPSPAGATGTRTSTWSQAQTGAGMTVAIRSATPTAATLTGSPFANFTAPGTLRAGGRLPGGAAMAFVAPGGLLYESATIGDPADAPEQARPFLGELAPMLLQGTMDAATLAGALDRVDVQGTMDAAAAVTGTMD